MDNTTLADRLRQHANDLDAEGGNLMRVRAYRRAAQTILEMDEPVTAILERDGPRGIRALPCVGRRIARTIESIICTGDVPPQPAVPAA